MKVRAVLGMLVADVLLSGCVSSQYKLAKPGDPRPPIALGLSVVSVPVEVTLQTVVAFQGPGSWKREAYWDEYIVTVANRGTTPFVLESGELTGLSGIPALAGTDPWVLESQSRTLAGKGFGLAKNVTVQIGSGVGTVSLGILGGAAIGGSGWAAIGGAVTGAAVALPIFVGGTIYRNLSSRQDIARDFQRRRHRLPGSLAPQQVEQGSFFFPITPSPRHLKLRGHAGSESFAITIDLSPIAELHLKTPAATAATVR